MYSLWWCRHIVVNALIVINEVTLCHARLVLVWVTICGRVNRFQPPRSTQPGHPSVGRCSEYKQKQCKLMSGWLLRKRRSAPPYGPCGLGRTLLYFQQVTYKLCLLTYKCLHGLAPPYLARLCVRCPHVLADLSCAQPINTSCLFHTPGQWLLDHEHSAHRVLHCETRCRHTFGTRRSVSTCSVSAWRQCCLLFSFAICLLFRTVVTTGAFVMIFVNCASLKCLFIIIIIKAVELTR